MIELTRSVRCAINPGQSPSTEPPPYKNGFGGSPAMRGLGRHYQLDVLCAGEPDAVTGYLVGIREIDRAVRLAALPLIADACENRPAAEPSELLPGILAGVDEELGGLVRRIRWRLTPTYSIEMGKGENSVATLRQRFDFAASHRLDVPGLSPEENQQLFGRCNKPSGHGHNYVLEPAVEVQLDSGGRPLFGLEALEQATFESVISRFDHAHLNLDTTEFAAEGGVNPSVENIARVCFDLLSPAVERASAGQARLAAVTVWETDRTSCTYTGPSR